MSDADSGTVASDEHRTSGSGRGEQPRPGPLVRLFHRLVGRPEEVPPVPRLIIGLGNPGPQYAETRHNVGFMAVDALVRREGLEFRPVRGPLVVAEGERDGSNYAVVKPAGLYMNQSGAAVEAALTRYGLNETDILVVYDDLALEPGQIRIRARGGSGGHNGIQSVVNTLGSDNFPRLRIGIGSSFPRGQQVDYVLGPFSPEQLPLIESGVERAVAAALAFVKEGIGSAMNRFNQR